MNLDSKLHALKLMLIGFVKLFFDPIWGPEG